MITVMQIVPTLGMGGSEQATLDIAEGLVNQGHRSLVISSGGSRVDAITQTGGIHLLGRVQSKNPIQMAANALWLKKIIKEYKVDIVHARSRAPAWSAYWASLGMDVKFVTTVHAAYKFNSSPKKYYNSVMMRGHKVIAISQFIASYIQENYHVPLKNIRTILRCIDLQKFSPELVTSARLDTLRAQWGLMPTETLILCPARLSPIKGHFYLIEALARLPKSRQFKTIFLGDDQGRTGYRDELINKIYSLGLRDTVKLFDHCSDMPAAYKLASLVVAPSVVPEGFGRVPIEAMAMGVPILATNLGGFAETIRSEQNGWLVSPKDPIKLAEALDKIMNYTSENLRTIIELAMSEVRLKYDKRKMVEDTLSVYKELVSLK